VCNSGESHYAECHYEEFFMVLSVIGKIFFMLRVIMLRTLYNVSLSKVFYSEFLYAGCHYAECLYTSNEVLAYTGPRKRGSGSSPTTSGGS
jgi:hypothetical protein